MEDAPSHPARRHGTPLTSHETALLELICAGTWRGADEARAQLAHARWGGKDHDGDACFLIEVPLRSDAPGIPSHAGGPIATLDVTNGHDPLGLLELWVHDGRLHSLEYSTFSDTAGEGLPELHQIDGITPSGGTE